MTNKVVILVTAGDRDEARKIASALVESRLAACANIVPNIESIYRWQGEVKNDDEALILLKTTRELFSEVEAEIRKLHSYTTPEIICLPIINGSADYLQWISDSVKSADEA